MSRITAVRSMTDRPMIFSRLAAGGRELVVEDDRVGVDGETRRQQVLGFPLPDEGGGLGPVASLHNAVGLVGTGRVDEQRSSS